jgi:membrane protein implicated in regulation of membrane protease activity
MPWWGWITIGALLLAAELTFVDLEFYLVFLGASALIVGMIGLSGVPLPFWLQWIVFAILGIGSLVLFRQRFYAKLHPAADAIIQEGAIGAWATATVSIAPGERGAVTLRGATWTARNVGSVPIPSGASCRVERTEGLILELRLDHEQEGGA